MIFIAISPPSDSSSGGRWSRKRFWMDIWCNYISPSIASISQSSILVHIHTYCIYIFGAVAAPRDERWDKCIGAVPWRFCIACRRLEIPAYFWGFDSEFDGHLEENCCIIAHDTSHPRKHKHKQKDVKNKNIPIHNWSSQCSHSTSNFWLPCKSMDTTNSNIKSLRLTFHSHKISYLVSLHLNPSRTSVSASISLQSRHRQRNTR